MAFVKRGNSNVKLTGFWTRTIGEVITGNLVKFVPNDKDKKNPRPFFIIQTKAPAKGEKATINIENGDKPVAVKGGEYVGIAANWSLLNQIDISMDVGKLIRVTSEELVDNPKGGKPMTIVMVEIDVEEPSPF